MVFASSSFLSFFFFNLCAKSFFFSNKVWYLFPNCRVLISTVKVHKQVIRKLHPDYAASSFSLISPMITLKFIVYLIFYPKQIIL